eukprot:TRINITY_DN1311_c2_g1_i1.p1 TRINITY_DN1311_c2_g1~~TRINITY_DN1311_c2_g1_i1.p1  ORF type:complete len:431 (-),score=66.19 TRINITY_DN1311_c2_g1_i1:129-1421(-)
MSTSSKNRRAYLQLHLLINNFKWGPINYFVIFLLVAVPMIEIVPFYIPICQIFPVKYQHKIMLYGDVQISFAQDEYGLGPTVGTFVDWIQDSYLKKVRVKTLNMGADASIFLGDLFQKHHWPDDKYFIALERFNYIFGDIPEEHMIAVGNHDIGYINQFRGYAFERYEKIFPRRNYCKQLFDYNFISVNSLAIQHEYTSRIKEYQKEIDDTKQFLKDFPKSCGAEYDPNMKNILIIHVPLYRNETFLRNDGKQACAPFTDPNIHEVREKLFIELVEEKFSKNILEKIKPSLILSGHHHHPCRMIHYTGDTFVVEDTISSPAWLQGNFFPSIALMYINQGNDKEIYGDPKITRNFFAENGIGLETCWLPNQYGIIIIYALVIVNASGVLFYVAITRKVFRLIFVVRYFISLFLIFGYYIIWLFIGWRFLFV